LSAEAYHIKSASLSTRLIFYDESDMAKVSDAISIYNYAGYPCIIYCRLNITGPGRNTRNNYRTQLVLLRVIQGLAKVLSSIFLCLEQILKLQKFQIIIFWGNMPPHMLK
jgi:hypothetical protein